MIKPFQVTAATSSQKAELPPAKQTVTLREFSFEAPQSLPAGQLTIAVKNAGTQAHEMSLVKLNNGVTAAQFKAAAVSTATPPPGPPPSFHREAWRNLTRHHR